MVAGLTLKSPFSHTKAEPTGYAVLTYSLMTKSRSWVCRSVSIVSIVIVSTHKSRVLIHSIEDLFFRVKK